MYLVFLKTILKDVLNDQATSLAKRNFMPHAAKGFIDVSHDLWRRLSPSELKKLLPDVARITVNNGLRDTTKKFMNHNGLIVFGNRVKSLLDNMTTECIHGKIQGIASNSLSNLYDLFRASVFEAALNQEVTEAVYHQRIGLSDDSLDDVVLLLSSTNLELLLKED